MRVFLVLIPALVLSMSLSQAQARLVKDINKTPTVNRGSNPGNYRVQEKGFFQFNNKYLFPATTEREGKELWITDGTASGTMLVKDIWPGFMSSAPDWFCQLRGKVYFCANDGDHGYELWVTDGTPGGTKMVVDIVKGRSSSHPFRLAAYRGKLFFSAIHKDSSNPAKSMGTELWVSDGTQAGTKVLKDIRPGPDNSYPGSLVEFNGKVYFAADDGNHGRELWETDGTSNGTKMMIDLFPGSGSSTPVGLTIFNNKIYFGAFDNKNKDSKLWVTDGTQAGTTCLKVLNGLRFVSPRFLVAAKGKLYFTVSYSTLWVTDGTTKGTLFLKKAFIINWLETLGSSALFNVWDSPYGDELWISDGTPKGTRLVKDLFQGAYSSSPKWLCRSGSTVFFSAETSATGAELWKTDGTTKGTVLVKDINPRIVNNRPFSSYPTSLTAMAGGKILLSADDGQHGSELWISNGSASGTKLVKDLNVVPPGASYGSSPTSIIDTWGTLWFSADDGVHGKELWRSDGTAAGTRLVKDLQPGKLSSYPAGFMCLGNKIVFTASVGQVPSYNRGLFVADTATGRTGLLKSINPGPANQGCRPQDLTVIGDRLFFVAYAPALGRELWVTDGTTAGTRLVKDIVKGKTGSNPSDLVAYKGTLLFSAWCSSSCGRELWRSDGTSAGTFMVKELYPGYEGSNPRCLTHFNGKLYFVAKTPKGEQVFVTDGTSKGTKSFIKINNLMPGYFVGKLVAAKSLLYIWASSYSSYWKLFRTDGTPGGTIFLNGANPAWSSGEFGHYSTWGDRLLFCDSDAVHGIEPWISDGTPKGTHMLKDIYRDECTSRPGCFIATGPNYAFFLANDGLDGINVWRTDGTEAGTVKVTKRGFKIYYTSYASLALSRGRLFFMGDDGVHGRELFSYFPGASTQQFGTGTTAAELNATEPVMGGSMKVKLSGLAKGQVGIVFIAKPNTMPFPSIPGGGYLYVNHFQFPLPSTGSVPVPNDPALIGATLALQAVTAPSNTPLGFGLTNGVFVTCGH